jgi:hypothetical protein
VSTDLPGRYRVTLTAHGRTIADGWWEDEVVARRKFTRWVGEYGGRPGGHVTLTDETTGQLLTEWPDGG